MQSYNFVAANSQTYNYDHWDILIGCKHCVQSDFDERLMVMAGWLGQRISKNVLRFRSTVFYWKCPNEGAVENWRQAP